MTTSPQPLEFENNQDHVDLDALFENTQPIGDGSELAAPEVFETQEELHEFLAWLRADRAAHTG